MLQTVTNTLATENRRYWDRRAPSYTDVIMKNLGIREISGICAADNTASCRVMEKSGFQPEYTGPGLYQGRQTEICRYIFRL